MAILKGKELLDFLIEVQHCHRIKQFKPSNLFPKFVYWSNFSEAKGAVYIRASEFIKAMSSFGYSMADIQEILKC